MVSRRDSSTLGTIVGLVVMGIAIAGTVFLDWSWSNPEGYALPLLLGVLAAIAGVIVVVGKRRS